MDITTLVVCTIAVFCVVLCWIAVRPDKEDTTPRPKNIALRDSAAIALSNYWSHYYEGWSLVRFRDVSGIIRHVACAIPNGKFFDAGGYCNVDQIGQRLSASVTAESCDEAEVQSLMGTNGAVLEAAEEWRHGADRKVPFGARKI
jgi:hypothetical protein